MCLITIYVDAIKITLQTNISTTHATPSTGKRIHTAMNDTHYIKLQVSNEKVPLLKIIEASSDV